MKIFLTGGTGNIGQYVTKELLERGHELLLLTRTPDRVPAFQNLNGVTLIKGSNLDKEVINKSLEGCDAVIHIALGWGNTPTAMLHMDTEATVFLLEAAEKKGVKNFIYTSSTTVMGSSAPDGKNENVVFHPENLYGATKAASEMYVLAYDQDYANQDDYGKKTSMRRNVIRPGYTFSNPAFEGGASESSSLFKDIVESVLRNEDIIASENMGTQFLSARQIAKLYADLVESNLNKEVFLAMGTEFVSLVDIINIAKSLVPESASKIIPPENDGGQRTIFDVSKMNQIFGLSFTGKEDLSEHIKWHLETAKKRMVGEEVADTDHSSLR